MNADMRKLGMTAHVTSSVGWLGAVVVFLVLSVAGLTSRDPQIVQAAYLTMHLVTWYAVVPLCLVALLTGVLQSMGTPWGLLRHYWVVVKLFLTIASTLLLFIHTRPIAEVASVAAQRLLLDGELRHIRLQLVGDAAAACFVLLGMTAISIFKPWGVTSLGMRLPHLASRPVSRRPAKTVLFLLPLIFVLLVLILHLAGGGFHGH
jgi:hypothetical protein